MDAHRHALRGIRTDASIGRLPFYDYAIDYFSYMGRKAPQPTGELVQFVESCETLGESRDAKSRVESIYGQYSLPIPIGLMDLPVWWATALIRSISEVNWVETDVDFTRTVFGWEMVHLQGSYLDIQYATALPEDITIWCPIANELLNLHRRLEPGPFTPLGRIVEFC